MANAHSKTNLQIKRVAHPNRKVHTEPKRSETIDEDEPRSFTTAVGMIWLRKRTSSQMSGVVMSRAEVSKKVKYAPIVTGGPMMKKARRIKKSTENQPPWSVIGAIFLTEVTPSNAVIGALPWS